MSKSAIMSSPRGGGGGTIPGVTTTAPSATVASTGSNTSRQAFTMADAELISAATRKAALGAVRAEGSTYEGDLLLKLIDSVLVDAVKTVSGSSSADS